jgi:hypothetical protein
MVTLSDLASDIAKNACESGADTVEIEVTEVGHEFRFTIKDNGKGMTGDEARRAVKPLSEPPVDNPTGKIGVGIPFLIDTVNEHAGGWNLHTEKGAGTTFAVWFDTTNQDTPPQGDIAGLFRDILLAEGPREVVIRRLRRTGSNDVQYELKKTDIAEAVGGLSDPASVMVLGTYLRALEANQPAFL